MGMGAGAAVQLLALTRVATTLRPVARRILERGVCSLQKG